MNFNDWKFDVVKNSELGLTERDMRLAVYFLDAIDKAYNLGFDKGFEEGVQDNEPK